MKGSLLKFISKISLVFAVLIASAVFVVSCGTKTVTPITTPSSPSVPATSGDSDEGGPNIDYVALKTSLGLDRPAEHLGFSERAYDTCKVGYGYSSTKYCHRQFFVVLHFQLVCRDSEGTVSEGIQKADMRALSGRPVKWSLKGISGDVQTDADGFGQIHTVSPVSQKTQRVKLSAGNDFLYMRANEITKVVTPKSWCNSFASRGKIRRL